jgi:Ribosomal protein S7
MSRRRKVYKKEEKVDSRYGSPAVARLISTVMKRGKKSLAERIVTPRSINRAKARTRSIRSKF